MDTIKITPPAGSPIEITPLSESYARTALQEIDTLVLHYELPEHTDLPLGSTASFRGTTYTLYKTSDLTMHHSRAYEYTATLYGDGERTRLYKVANLVDGRLSFTLTAKPHEHLQMLVDTLNKREGAGTWTAGSVPDGTEITIAYDHISVLDALVQLATKLETEWGITGTTLHIGKLTSSSEPLSLRYGRGKGILPDIRRTPVDDYPIGRLYANGGSRNIDPSTYGSKTLHFPKGATETYDGQVYHTDPTGTYVYTEGAAATSSDTSIDLTHIYPSRIGSVAKVEVTNEGAVDILDSTIPETLDYEKQLLEGQTLTVKFETGMLAGREPFGAKYIHRDRRFQIVPRDEDGVTLPGGVYLPKEGDKYAVFGCSLPLEYITNAETAMLSEAVKYLHSHRTGQYGIAIELDGIYTKQHWGEIGSRLALGHRVRFTDPSWQPTPVDIRILGITTYLSRPYSPKLDLSNSPLPSSFTAVIKRVEGDQLVREEEYRGGLRRLERRTYEDAKATREMIERLRVEGFTHSITPETLRTLQAVIGSPSLQFSFGRDDGQELFPFEYEWRKGKTELHIPGRQYILQEKGDKTLSPDAKQKVTEMAEYTYSLKDEETQLYLYADLTEQSYKVSATPMEITDTRLLVALIHGVGEDRTLTPLYGFTEITPGQLKTDLIRSQDGKSYWDLLTGKFATKGDLLIGDPKGNTCLAYIDGVLYVKGLTVNVGSSSTTIEDALIEQERKIENAKKVRQPIIKNGTWWVWDDTTNQLIDSGKPAQGATGATGAKGEKGEKGEPGKDVDPKVLNDLKTAVDDAWRKLDDTVTKAELDGVVSAQEQKDIQFAKEALNAAKKAYDDAVKKAKELDDDFQARMDSHMQQIYQEVVMTQQVAGAARQQTEVLHQYVDGAYKDGIITEVESKAIATYINEVEAMWSSAFGAYELVYSNALLAGASKTALGDAKITLAGAKDNLISQIKRAISDGKATKEEAAETERLYNVYKGALQDFQKALKVAEDAIRDAAVGEVGSGSLNYFPADVVKEDKNRSIWRLRLANGFFRAVPVGVEVPINIGYDVYFDNDRTDNKVKTTFFYTDEGDSYKDGSRRYIHYSITTGLKGRAWHHIWKSGKVARLDKHVRIMGWLADTVDTGAYPSGVRNVYLRVGSRDLGWTPAPEDLQAAIDAERAARETAVREVATGLSSANTLIQSLEKAQEMLDTGKLNKADLPDVQYLLDSLKNGATSKKGGLLLTNDIILSDPNSKDVTASMSGTRTRGAKAIRLGIKYSGDHVDYLFNAPFFNAEYDKLTNLEDDNAREKRINELGYSVAEYNKFLRNWRVYPTAEKKDVGETTAFFNNGIAHIGGLFFNGEYISFGTEKDSYMQIGGSAKPESEMVSASTEIRKFRIASRTMTGAGTATLDMFDSLYSNREIKYTANLSAIASARACEVRTDGEWDPSHHRYNPPTERVYARTESYVTAQLKLELRRGGNVIKTVTSPEVSASAVARGGQSDGNELTPQGNLIPQGNTIPQSKLYASDSKSQAVTVTISPSDVRERDTVTLSLITTTKRYCATPPAIGGVELYTETSASAEDIINYLPYDTSQPMVSVTKDKAAFFYGRSKYILLNYLRDCVMKVVGNMIIQGNLILKGDLTAENADFPGAPLIGGMVTKDGSFKKSFGRHKNQSGRNFPQVSYDYSTKTYTVYHSIGNDNYIPVLSTGNNAFSDQCNWKNVTAYSFQVNISNANGTYLKQDFTYVCFKAD